MSADPNPATGPAPQAAEAGGTPHPQTSAASRSIYTPELREAVLRLRGTGMSHNGIAKHLGIATDNVEYVVRVARADGDARASKRHHRGRVVPWAERQDIECRHVPVPEWATRAGLDLRYLSIAETYGEHAAAKHCRAVIASRNPASSPRPAVPMDRGEGQTVPAAPANATTWDTGRRASAFLPDNKLSAAAGGVSDFSEGAR